MTDIEPLGNYPIYSEGSLDDPGEYCCEFLKHQLSGTCRGTDIHVTGTIQCPDQVITYNAKLREYSIEPLGGTCYTIRYCPACGKQFPKDLRDEWFDALEQLGVDRNSRPEEFNSDTWWKNRNL